jgi:hypothetical protein
VVLHDTDYVPFMACLEFIYSGQVKIPDPDFAIELVLKPHDTHDTQRHTHTRTTRTGAEGLCSWHERCAQIGEANKLQLVRLKALCEDLISKNIDIENAAYVYQVASYHAVPRLRSIALVRPTLLPPPLRLLTLCAVCACAGLCGDQL